MGPNILKKRIQDLSTFLINISKILSIVLLISLTSIVVVNVFLRYIFRYPLSWGDEIARLLIVWVVFFASGIAFDKGLHIGITLILSFLPIKVAKQILLYSKFLILAVMLILTRDGFNLAIHSSRAIMPASEISQIWLYIPIPIGSIFVIVYIINSILNAPETSN
jgi:TRAP-type C4-dicarboxylate transport system permease small subunit